MGESERGTQAGRSTRAGQGTQAARGAQAGRGTQAGQGTEAGRGAQAGPSTQAGQSAGAERGAQVGRVRVGLAHGSSSVRLRVALAAGTVPDPQVVDVLVERCAVEPEFFVRETLTWALTRQPASVTVPRLIEELRSASGQARSQALHTLSKIGDRRAWPAITHELLTDADDEVARSAWRAAVVLVPEGAESGLVAVLATQLGRGERETQLSLSRALVGLGEVIMPVLHAATTHPDPRVRQHAIATEQLWRDPDTGFDFAVEEAKRIVALGPEG